MSYNDVETALATQIAAIAGFSTAAGTGNVTRGDFRLVTRGISSGVVLEYAGFDDKLVAEAGQFLTDWKINIDLFIRWLDDENAYTVSKSARQAILDRIRQFPKLGTSIVFHAMIESGDPSPEDLEMGGVRYAFEILRLTATEDVSVSYAE